MATVGIIANPVSGKDIRRLVAHGSVFDNQEKVRIVRRMLMGLERTGVRRVLHMQDYYAIVDRAARGCDSQIEITAATIPMENSQLDSTRAAHWMVEHGARCLIVLGGDGTCRAVAKGTLAVPLLPISTGTNNVFPQMIEASIAGLAAGLIATGRVPSGEGTYRSSCLEVLSGDTLKDMALVDVAVSRDTFVASRAIWDLTTITQVFLTRCRPDSIGLSAIGGQLRIIPPWSRTGLHLVLGSGDRRVTAAIGPGLFQSVAVKSAVLMNAGESIAVDAGACVLALDGEREVDVAAGEPIAIRLCADGPRVVDVARTMESAQVRGLFVENIQTL